jgi:hypothetical protein
MLQTVQVPRERQVVATTPGTQGTIQITDLAASLDMIDPHRYIELLLPTMSATILDGSQLHDPPVPLDGAPDISGEHKGVAQQQP